MQHTQLLYDVRDRLEAEGHSATTERANWFRLEGNAGAQVGGQAGLVAVTPDEQVTVYDVQTGAQRDSDVAQVMIYMYALPLVTDSLWAGESPDGRLVYRDGAENFIPATAIDSDFREGLHDLIRRVVFDDPARRVSSPPEYNWGDLTKLECRERIDSNLLLWHVRFRAGRELTCRLSSGSGRRVHQLGQMVCLSIDLPIMLASIR